MLNGDIWKCLWAIPCLPKVTNLLCKVANNCLPTRVRLMQKQAINISIYPVCNTEEETIIHALVTCDFAKEVWSGSGLGWYHGNTSKFTERLEVIFTQLHKYQ